MLFTPEMSLLLDRDRQRAARHVETQARSDYVCRLATLAAEHTIWIALGSMAVTLRGGKWANRSLLFRPDSAEPLCYDKLHMFDVDLPEGESWRESNTFAQASRSSWRTQRRLDGSVLPSAMTCDFQLCSMLSASGSATSSPCRPPLRRRPAKRTGMFSCAPELSRRAPMWSPRRRSATMPTAGRPMAILWWSIHGARSSSTWAAMDPASGSRKSRVIVLPRFVVNCPALPTAVRSPHRFDDDRV